MTEDEALRVLGLEAPIDPERVQHAFASQMLGFRTARVEARDPDDRERLDRAIELTRAARERLLPDGGRQFHLTRELPRLPQVQVTRGAWMVVGVGVALVAITLLLFRAFAPASDGAETVLRVPAATLGDRHQRDRVDRVDRGAGPEHVLAGVRAPLFERWAAQGPDGAARIPARTAVDGVELPAPPSGWTWSPQRQGIIGLVALTDTEAAESDWLLAAPLIEAGRLRWACFSRNAAHADCFHLGADALIDRRAPLGHVDARALAEALARLPPERSSGAFAAERWYRQAADQLRAVVEGEERWNAKADE